MNTLFVKLIGTLAVILVVASIIGGSNLLHRFFGNRRSWKYVLIAGLLGGIFGIYGNISGIDYNGAVISVRDIGPMLAGFIGGPWGGLLGGLIAGAHRYTMGGITAEACIIATCCIGTMCGL
ncbi:MAG: histidine kinase, partial [Firmicutes bacterium]|nr:histidine kinase [Bacillota bacterium]